MVPRSRVVEQMYHTAVQFRYCHVYAMPVSIWPVVFLNQTAFGRPGLDRIGTSLSLRTPRLHVASSSCPNVVLHGRDLSMH